MMKSNYPNQGSAQQDLDHSGSDIAVLMLTPRCDMACTFCGAPTCLQELSQDQAQAAVALMAGQGMRSVVLGGGEPLAWRGDLWRLAGFAKKAGLEVQVGSNALALPPDFARRPQVDRWVFPLESAVESLHNEMRPHSQGHFQRIHWALDQCRKAGRAVTVSTLVARETMPKLPLLAAWLRRYVSCGGSLHAWHLYRFQPEGRGSDYVFRYAVDPVDYQRQCRALRRDFSDLRIYLRPDLYHSKRVAFFHAAQQRLWRQDRLGLYESLCHLPCRSAITIGAVSAKISA